MKKAVIVKVPVELIGDAIGVKEEGGIINQAGLEVEIKCLPMDIPNVIEVNIEELSIGDTLIASAMDLDEKLELISSQERLIVSVTLPMKEIEPEVEEELEEELEEGEEGEEGVAEKDGEDSEEESKESEEANSNDGSKS